jgi:hypothetical protein
LPGGSIVAKFDAAHIDALDAVEQVEKIAHVAGSFSGATNVTAAPVVSFPEEKKAPMERSLFGLYERLIARAARAEAAAGWGSQAARAE